MVGDLEIRRSIIWLEGRRDAFALHTVPAAKHLELHLQVFHIQSDQAPLLCEVESAEVIGVSLSIKAEFETELVDELGVDSTLIENWHHERPIVEVQNEMTEKAEEELDNSRLEENQAGVQGSGKCLFHGVPITKAEGISKP